MILDAIVIYSMYGQVRQDCNWFPQLKKNSRGLTTWQIHFMVNRDQSIQYDDNKRYLTLYSNLPHSICKLDQRNMFFCSAKAPVPIFYCRFSVLVLLPRTDHSRQYNNDEGCDCHSPHSLAFSGMRRGEAQRSWSISAAEKISRFQCYWIHYLAIMDRSRQKDDNEGSFMRSLFTAFTKTRSPWSLFVQQK